MYVCMYVCMYINVEKTSKPDEGWGNWVVWSGRGRARRSGGRGGGGEREGQEVSGGARGRDESEGGEFHGDPATAIAAASSTIRLRLRSFWRGTNSRLRS